ncbi:unnamed protein product [Citrullus colocynthis]|uniref:Uncharacterized protein n=1 Tax=Citrullus colocynthis TaxID=252529 RepID=A0ABP0XUY2_9ROSI
MALADLMANSSSSCHHNVAASSLKRKRREAREVRRKVQKLRAFPLSSTSGFSSLSWDFHAIAEPALAFF